MTLDRRPPLAALCGCPPATRSTLEAAGIPAVDVSDAAALPRRLAGARAVVAGPAADAAEVVATCRTHAPGILVVAWRPDADRRDVRALLRAGADDVVLGPDGTSLATALTSLVRPTALLAPAGPLDARSGFERIVGRSRALGEVIATCAQVAPTSATVLILGETGTGKELLAQAIHRRSARPGRFVALDRGASPSALVEAFQRADGGTLFLDEVGSLPGASQLGLLRVLQQGRVRPGGEELPVDVRLVAGTSEPLDAAVEAGRLRADLFDRLDVIRVAVPPLRERRDDVPLLFESFCRELARRYDLPPPEVTPGFVEALRAHPWPGNARQLRSVAERLVLTRRGRRLDAAQLAELLAFDAQPGPDAPLVEPGVTLEAFLAPRVTALERRYLEDMLRQHHGRMQATATAAGMSRRTLLRKLHQLGIDRRQFRKGRRPRSPGDGAAGGG